MNTGCVVVPLIVTVYCGPLTDRLHYWGLVAVVDESFVFNLAAMFGVVVWNHPVPPHDDVTLCPCVLPL